MAGLRVIQVDPGLFTEPYDAALSESLRLAGIHVTWVTRHNRPGCNKDVQLPNRKMLFYLGGAALSAKQGSFPSKLKKGLSHFLSCFRLIRLIAAERPDLVHFQWINVPILDSLLVLWIKRSRPVVFTVHDLDPRNFASSKLQTLGFYAALRAPSCLITHTERGRGSLIDLGISPARIQVIGHGPLHLSCERTRKAPAEQLLNPPKWRVVMFGKIQKYKGLDILVSAIESMDPAARSLIHVVVAGEPFMQLGDLVPRMDALGFERRLYHLPDEEADTLLESAHVIVFPYYSIEASGVLHLMQDYQAWLVASDLGAFREVIRAGQNGELIVPGDAQELSRALTRSIGKRRRPGAMNIPSWSSIGLQTRAVYESLIRANRERGYM